MSSKNRNKNKKQNKYEEQNSKDKKRHKNTKKVQNSPEYQKHLKEFNEQLSEYNLYIKDVEGDGNCLFRSISDQLDGNEEYHAYYRKIVVEQIKSNQDFFKNFIYDIELDKYVKEMQNIGTWGGNMEIQAISQALGHNFIIYTKNRPFMVIKGVSVKGITKKTIQLAYHYEDKEELHYSSIRNISELNVQQELKNQAIEILIQQLNEEDNKTKNIQNQNNRNKVEKQEQDELKQTESQIKDLKIEENQNENKIGRNQKCLCGSRKAYKKCCMFKDSQNIKQEQNKEKLQKQAIFI
ncbi:OTU-like cysteine protease family protein, putative [Ichthyophthirius multifiliis]|uniref:OTU-like cysteine protease family protein, putative n=1 Tax=Ichthyophthirius multifiliis TaxID=5932 RepID=G0QJ77_ICHMU|nr:OTU-like cysteine protease family protein, putative [Ichthyophthirius multifiliis]EGR34728.1 OTU-like cysteine protease family protein, putative [Ichthyophthirius multifiliis]|eukprot:XP_004040032.1 OTU-like cysteine protease family protein, putative [Ichthyophthirius multifiliis]